jgi:hypothetical protein
MIATKGRSGGSTFLRLLAAPYDLATDLDPFGVQPWSGRNAVYSWLRLAIFWVRGSTGGERPERVAEKAYLSQFLLGEHAKLVRNRTGES